MHRPTQFSDKDFRPSDHPYTGLQILAPQILDADGAIGISGVPHTRHPVSKLPAKGDQPVTHFRRIVAKRVGALFLDLTEVKRDIVNRCNSHPSREKFEFGGEDESAMMARARVSCPMCRISWEVYMTLRGTTVAPVLMMAW